MTAEPMRVVVPLTPEQMYEVTANLRTWADTIQRFEMSWIDGAETPETIRGWADALDHATPVDRRRRVHGEQFIWWEATT